MPPTREQLDAMRENIHNLLTTCPPREPDGSEDEPNLAVYSYAWQCSWLDMDAQLRWTSCSEAMPTDDAPVEFVAGLDHRVLATGRRTKAPAITDLIWWADDGTLWADKFVTHWRPWSGWPGEEAGK